MLTAVLAFMMAAARINHGLLDSSLPPGPGLTLDESFNVHQGVYLVRALRQHGPLLFTPAVANQVFGANIYLPDHPPLGRLLLGLAHETADWLIDGAEICIVNVSAARLGACAAMSLTVLLLTAFVQRRYGTVTALTSAAALILMPQFTGHARLATLEIPVALAWFAALLPLLAWWTGQGPPSTRQAVISGLFWGLLMLTKMQGILLPPMVVVWALWKFRLRAIRPLLVWGCAGCLIFWAAWPWLWLDPATHLLSYLGRAADRQTLYVWYFGQKYADTQVPWHYSFVMPVITAPPFVLLGLCWRFLLRRLDDVEQFLTLAMLWPLCVFAAPGVPVYDGIRLLLCILPPAAILTGRGSVQVVLMLLEGRRQNHPSAIGYRWTPIAVLLTIASAARLLAAFAYMSPSAISEYSDLVGGSPGAARLGMEASYWADGVNGEFWQHVPRNSVVLVAPVSHQFQLSALEELVPVIKERGIRLEPFQYDREQRGLTLLLHRLADLRVSLREVPPGATPMLEVRGDGVVLARLIDTTDASWESVD